MRVNITRVTPYIYIAVKASAPWQVVCGVAECYTVTVTLKEG